MTPQPGSQAAARTSHVVICLRQNSGQVRDLSLDWDEASMTLVRLLPVSPVDLGRCHMNRRAASV